MIEFLGFLYGIAKDIKYYLEWDEEAKSVDREWLEKSGFGKRMEEQGYNLYWSKPESVETRKLDGYEVMYEIDKIKRIKRHIERTGGRDPLILMGKKKEEKK